MSRGPKLNEGALVAEQRTKATAKYVRSSAYKAREVLDLIRGLDVQRADEVLQFTERAIARDVRKVLASAVANATDPNNGAYIGDADELFVLACFADEGPTLRRFRPRARGRATRIRKRSCHITVVVARMSDQRLEVVRARAEGASASAVANRRARVERSRKRAEAARAATGDATVSGTEPAATVSGTETADEVESAEDAVPDTDPSEEVQAADEAAEDVAEAEEAAEAAEEVTDGFQPGEYAGSVLPDEDGNGPDTHPIKGNADSMLYHTPDSRYYKVTKAEVWFDTEEHAEAAGFSKPATAATDTTNDTDED